MDATLPVTNAAIADALRHLAELLRHERANPFKVRAYRAAAAAVERHPVRLAEVVERGEPLPRIAGVGPSISSAIRELVTSGALRAIERLDEKHPRGTAEVARAAGVTMKQARRIVEALDVHSPAELESKVESGELAAAVGGRLELKVRQGLTGRRRMLWNDAHAISTLLREGLLEVPGVTTVEIAGGVRRGEETVGSITLLAHARQPAQVGAWLRGHGAIERVEFDEAEGFACELATGVSLHVALDEPESWGDALVRWTGSEAHVAAAAGRRIKRTFETEKAWYEARGLAWIPPELRENRGEIEAAAEGELPDLVAESQIKGDLHMHTTASDGSADVEEMVAAARERGYAYIAITDHSHSLRITNGLSEKRLRQQMRAIDQMNERLKGFRVLKGSEVDILEDGSLDFQDDVLRDLDVVIASVHSRFQLDKRHQTQRLVRAASHPLVTCLGHLTGRKLLRRPGYDFDLAAVLKAIRDNGKWLEINSSPDRLDISDVVAQEARRLGIPLLINSDAHSVGELDFMKFGVQQARRGWQSAETVYNTLSLTAFLGKLKLTRPARRKRLTA